MPAKAKTIKLLLLDGTMDGVIYIEDSLWNGGELYSSSREKITELLDIDTCDKYGIYLLVSNSRVYVGQSINLRQRITQHIIGKDWWDRAVLITTKGDVLNKSDIDYMESVLIEKAHIRGTIDVDNISKGNPAKVERFREVELKQFLDEALSLLELIGVTVFSKTKANRIKKIVNIIDKTSEEERELRSKNEAKGFVESHGINVRGFISYAKIAEARNYYWINPSRRAIQEEWTIILNNQKDKIITVLNVPSNSYVISNGPTTTKSLKTRRDRTDRIDLKIDSYTLTDIISGCDFSKFLVKKIQY